MVQSVWNQRYNLIVKRQFKTKAKLREYKSDKGSWFYLVFDKKLTEELRATVSKKHGWPRVKVTSTIGKTTWPTYIFKYKESYCLVVKKDVREAEGIKRGDEVTLLFEI